MPHRLTEHALDEIRRSYSALLNFDSADILDPIDPLTYKDPDGDTLLHFAALRGDERTTRLLLDAGCDPNAFGDMGNTPLHYACGRGCQHVVALLLEHGARKDIRNEFGQVPCEKDGTN